MQTVQRHFGRYMKRSADDSQVSLLLKDFEDADQLLTKMIEESKRWRDAWTSILMHQQGLFSEFELLYNPIVGASDTYHGHVAVVTPEHLVARSARLRAECEELKKDLKDILDQVDLMMIKPAQDTRDNLHLLRKTIKKREDKKLDFERYQNRVDTGMKKKGRSDRDNTALAKAERDLAVATEQYSAADENLRNSLPPLLQAVYSLQPHLLAAQVQIQNSLLGHYYTALHNYCTDEGFPSPAPPMDEVVRVWDDAVRPIQRDIESVNILANGKLVRKGAENGAGGGGGSTGTRQTNGYRRPSQNSSAGRGPSVSPARPAHTHASSNSNTNVNDIPSAASGMNRPKISSSASSTSLLSAHSGTQNHISHGNSYDHSPQPPQYLNLPTPSPSHSVYATPATTNSTTAKGGDYFSRLERKTSHPLTSTTFSSANSSSSALSSIIAGKKKPPPPPPARIPSSQHQFQFVTALYDFGGQSKGDLVFREGDKIKVIKKTESTDDWWQGELRGVKGMFPANYCS